MTDTLMKHGEPVYQPALQHGIRYREPWSRTTATGWFRGDDDEPYQEEVSREDVASMLGVEVRDLIAWENATDLAAEEDYRTHFGLGDY